MDPIIFTMVRGKYYTEFVLERLKGKDMKDAEEKAQAMFDAWINETKLGGSKSLVAVIAEAIRAERTVTAYKAAALVDRNPWHRHEAAERIRALADHADDSSVAERENAKLKNELQNLKELYNFAITKLGKIEDIMEDR